MRLLPCIWLLSLLGFLVQGSQHGQHPHHELHHRHKRALLTPEAIGLGDVRAPDKVSEAADTVERALQVLKVANKHRLENVQYNRYEFASVSEIRGSGLNSAPLKYSENMVKMLSNIQSRAVGGASASPEQYSYSIPQELRDAARVVAESTHLSPTGNHSAVAARMRTKYGTNVSDTLVPPQAVRDSGIYEFRPTEMDLMYSATGLDKRASSSWWMADMEQRGVSPYAPEGYKVCTKPVQALGSYWLILLRRSGEMLWTMVRLVRPNSFLVFRDSTTDSSRRRCHR